MGEADGQFHMSVQAQWLSSEISSTLGINLKRSSFQTSNKQEKQKIQGLNGCKYKGSKVILGSPKTMLREKRRHLLTHASFSYLMDG